jgi:hypothetical protein
MSDRPLVVCDGENCPLKDFCLRYRPIINKLKELHLSPTPTIQSKGGKAYCSSMIEKLVRKDEESTKN